MMNGERVRKASVDTDGKKNTNFERIPRANQKYHIKRYDKK